MTDTIIKRIRRKTADRGLLVITAGASPSGFSIVAHLYEARGRRPGAQRQKEGREPDMVGMLHEEILAAAPDLAPLVAVHLAGPEGVPIHAIANGWYLYSGESRAYEEDNPQPWHNPQGLSDHQRAARALHIAPEDLPEGMSRDEFTGFVESLRPKWREQARAARELLESL